MIGKLDPEAILKMSEAEIKAEFEALKIHSMAGGYGGRAGNVHAQAYPIRPPPRVYSLREKLEMRMNWQPGVLPTCFAHVEVQAVHDKAFIWVLTRNAQSVVLEDEAALFPSDALITKVRMMVG